MGELVNLKNELKFTIRALLKSYPTPMTVDMLEKDYFAQVGENIPFAKLGYTSLQEYVKSMPEAVTIELVDDIITLKASDTVYVGQLPRNYEKRPSNGNDYSRGNGDFFVSHHVQHPFYKFIMDRKAGVTVSELEEFWEGGQTLAENGLQCTVREFLKTYISHLSYLREDRVYPVNLKNLQKTDTDIPDVPVLRLASHIDDRTKNFIRNVLARHPDGINYCKFPEVYKLETGVHFDSRFWGYHSVLEMAIRMPELFHCTQTGSSDWHLSDARQPIPQYNKSDQTSLNSNMNSDVNPVQHLNGYSDDRKCNCEKIASVVRRLYGKGEFLKTLKSSVLSSDTPCNKFHKIPQLKIPPHVIPGTTLDVHISEVVSPNRFYFVLKGSDGKEVLDHLLVLMYEFYFVSHSQFHVKQGDVVEGLFCVVLYNERCLRAQVCAILDGEVSVRFVDYGVVASVNIDNLHYLHPAFGFLPQQALVGSIAHLRPVDDRRGWSQDATRFLYNTLVNSLVTAVVTSVNSEQQVMTAELVAETDDQEYIHINKMMVSLGYALCDNI